MSKLTQHTIFCLNHALVYTRISKKLDNQLSIHGINFSEFMILLHLDQAIDNKLKRIDLAEKIGLSASGVTRLVTPMEKIGLLHKEANKRDARVSLVKLSSSGQRILQEATVNLNAASQEILSKLEESSISEMLKTLSILGGNIRRH